MSLGVGDMERRLEKSIHVLRNMKYKFLKSLKLIVETCLVKGDQDLYIRMKLNIYYRYYLSGLMENKKALFLQLPANINLTSHIQNFSCNSFMDPFGIT